MSLWTLPLSFAAGVLTIASPCVLSLVPIVVAGARAQDPRAPLALAAGMAATFAIVGGLLASIGVDFGDGPYLREIAAVAILLVGLALLSPALGHKFAAALAPLQRLGGALENRLPRAGLLGHAAAGALLALVWAPCAGPTLAAAFLLAARGGGLPFAMLSMGVFALGAASALLALGYGVGRLAGKRRGAALATGAAARMLFGAAFCLVGALILTSWDHRLESFAVAHTPGWLTRLTTSV